MPTKLTNEIITAAILGFEQQKRHIDTQIAELRASLSGSGTTPATTPKVPKGKRRNLGAAARKRIGDAQRKRWAESKGEVEPPSKTVSVKPKRKMSAAGRKAISEATKKRWAAFHAAKAAPVVAKKAAAKKATATKAPVKVAKKAPIGKPQKKTSKASESAATATA